MNRTIHDSYETGIPARKEVNMKYILFIILGAFIWSLITLIIGLLKDEDTACRVCCFWFNIPFLLKDRITESKLILNYIHNHYTAFNFRNQATGALARNVIINNKNVEYWTNYAKSNKDVIFTKQEYQNFAYSTLRRNSIKKDINKARVNFVIEGK